MDVDRLMRDLTVEELEAIQLNLEKEMEHKKESLRDMVGRRYRDVLEASSEVRHVCQLAEQLATDVATVRVTQRPIQKSAKNAEEKRCAEMFYALHSLLAKVGGDDVEPLDDAICLHFIEHLHKQLIAQATSTQIYQVARTLSNRVVKCRRNLEQEFVETLDDLSQSDWAANQLAAIAVLQGKSVIQLLELYLEKRKQYVVGLVNGLSPILTIIEELKKTLLVVEELFVNGQLQYILQTVSNGQFHSETIERVTQEQAFTFDRTMAEEVEKMGGTQLRKLVATPVGTAEVERLCDEWIKSVCNDAHQLVSDVCGYMESIDQVVEMVRAIVTSLHQNWPRVGSNRDVYNNLIKTSVTERLKALVEKDLNDCEKEAKSKIGGFVGFKTSLFDEKAYTVEACHHLGVSPHIMARVREVLEKMGRLSEECRTFEDVCKTMADASSASQLRQSIAVNVDAFFIRLCEEASTGTNGAPYLLRAMVSLALLSSDPELITELLHKDQPRILNLNMRLQKLVEENLVQHAAQVIEDTVDEENLSPYLEALTSPLHSASLALEWQEVDLPDVGKVQVPCSMSAVLQNVLFMTADRLSDSPVAHLFALKMKQENGALIAKRLSDILGQHLPTISNLPSRSLTQILFDLKLLNSMFNSSSIRELATTVEAKLDPFDVSLLAPLISSNLRIAHARTQILLAPFIAELVSNKEVEAILTTASKIQDIAVHVPPPPRISAIPRFDPANLGSESRRAQESRTAGRTNRYLVNPANQQQGSKGSAPSLTAFYDRISSSWFGN